MIISVFDSLVCESQLFTHLSILITPSLLPCLHFCCIVLLYFWFSNQDYFLLTFFYLLCRTLFVLEAIADLSCESEISVLNPVVVILFIKKA